MSTTINPTATSRLFRIDAGHSSAEFVVRHLMISKVRGRFSALQGTIELGPDSDLPQAVDVAIETASVDTRESQRDAHLRSADFFDAETYPAIVYRSTRIEGTPESFKVYGELTLHGVTREVVLDGTFEGAGADPWGGRRAGYSAQTKSDRKDFGLTWNQALEAGGIAVGDEVRIELNVEAIRQ